MDEEDLVLTLRKFPRTPQPWESLGSEVEVEEENVTESRPKVSCSTCKSLIILSGKILYMYHFLSQLLQKHVYNVQAQGICAHFFVSLHVLKGTMSAWSHAQ